MINPNLEIGLIALARTTFDLTLAREVFNRARKAMDASGISLRGPDALIPDVDELDQAMEPLLSAELDLVVVLQTTFADSSMVTRIANSVEAPLLLWAVPEAHTGGRLGLNSLCGVNLAAHALTRNGYSYDTLYADPSAEEVFSKIRTLAQAGRARRNLSNAVIGRIGEHPAGLDTCSYDAQALKEIFGVEILPLDLGAVFKRAREIDVSATTKLYKQLDGDIEGLDTLDPQATQTTLATYLSLKRMTKEQELNGLAVRCWPEFFTELGCAACGAMSMLSDELIPCSCEADVNGTITQLILQSISESPAFGTDIVSLDDKRDALVIWHCGLAPGSMADPREPIRGTIHSNRELPLLFEFTLKPGPVTVARLSEASGGYRLVVGRAQMVQGPKSFSGTSGLLQFDRSAKEVLNVILTEGLEHHISLTYGDYLEALITFAALLNIPILDLNE